MNVSDRLTHAQQMLFALLKLALWKTIPDKVLFEKANGAIWEEVYYLSVYQGIKAVIFDAVMLLPEELQPSRSVKLAWAVNAEDIERKYEQNLAVANEITGIFAENNIEILLIKGIGVAQYYPAPKHREFGDIDFYLFEKQKEGDRLLVRSGAVKNKYNTGKHTGFHYKGSFLENHNYFLNKSKFRNFNFLEKYLLKTLVDDKPLISPVVNNALFPPPNFNIVFLLCHVFGHFLSGRILLKYVCDWALFLKANRGNIDFAAYRRVIGESGFMKFADAFTALAVKYLELDTEAAPPFDSNPELEDRIMQESFHPLFFSKTEKRSLLKIVNFKLKMLKSRKWKYDELFYPFQFYKVIGDSIFSYIAHPAAAVKLPE